MDKKPGADMRFNDHELGILKKKFAGDLEAIKLLRKIFLPEITPDAPIGQTIDLWMTDSIETGLPEDIVINVKARTKLIKHVETCLQMINVLAGAKEETVEDTKKKLLQNSNK